MPRKSTQEPDVLVSWDGPPNFRWVKMHAGSRHRVTCEELGLPQDLWTKEASYQAANAWWQEKVSQLQPKIKASDLISQTISGLSLDTLTTLREKGKAAEKLLLLADRLGMEGRTELLPSGACIGPMDAEEIGLPLLAKGDVPEAWLDETLTGWEGRSGLDEDGDPAEGGAYLGYFVRGDAQRSEPHGSDLERSNSAESRPLRSESGLGRPSRCFREGGDVLQGRPDECEPLWSRLAMRGPPRGDHAWSIPAPDELDEGRLA